MDDKTTFTKEQIFHDLEQTLTPYEWSEIQKVSEEGAKRCGLCWLNFRIKPYMGRRKGPLSGWLCLNPNFPVREWKNCMDRFPDDPDFQCHVCGFDAWRPWEGTYELAREFWALHRTSPHYVVPPEPPMLPPKPPEGHEELSERWVDFPYEPLLEGPRNGFFKMILAPQVIRHFEWEKQYKLVPTFAEYLDRHFRELAEGWKDSLSAKEYGLFRWYIGCGGCGSVRKQYWRKDPNHWIRDLQLEDGWEIFIRKADGSFERMPGIYYTLQQGGHRRERFETWYKVQLRNKIWLSIHSSPADEIEAKRRDFLTKQTEEINDYLEKDGKDGCPEPDSIDSEYSITDEECDEMK